MIIDPVALTQNLIRCPSVTPLEGGALALLEEHLSAADFTCVRVDRGKVSNLFARIGPKAAAKTFGFNGHTDVVPVGDEGAWSKAPFGAEVEGDWLYGRGATDMKSGVACFAAAAAEVATELPEDTAVILAITGDEEAEAIDGTRALLDWMAAEGERMSVCLVGEPTCPDVLGDVIKIGRRGSLSAQITCRGKQGHAAYPHKALNPLPALARLADRLASHVLDEGTAHFDPSTLALTSIDTGNTASNVIPASTRLALNIRFNDLHTGDGLLAWLRDMADDIADKTAARFEVSGRISGEAFLTPPGDLSKLVSQAVEAETGLTPTLSTSGGTSDARFVKRHCPVVEFGLVGHRMHEVDERVSIQDIRGLTDIYKRILRNYFA